MKDKAPERIWAYTNDGYSDRMTDHGTWDTGIEGQPDCHLEWPHAPYIRADLTPSPAPERLLLIGDGLAVKVGGSRFDGWLFRHHPDGQWISVRKLEEGEMPQ